MLIRIAIISLILCSNTLSASIAKVPIISGYMFEHYSSTLKQNRRYMVSLPERYYSNDRHYPTIYVVDSDFQFQHTSALITNLSRMGKIPPMIVIGIANQGQQDYIYQTTWSAENNSEYGGAPLFNRYIEQELVPLIKKNYRTNSQQALAGYSLGLFATYAMMQKNTPFNAFIAMSPSAWFDDYSITKMLPLHVARAPNTTPALFLSVADEEKMGVRKLVEALKNNAKEQKSWYWQFKTYPNETHFSTAMPALYDALIFLSPGFYLDPQEMMKLDSYKDVLDIFEQKKTLWTGFQFEWLQAYQLAKYMFWSKQLDHVDDFIKEVFLRFPESHPEVVIQLAKGFTIKKQPARAQQLLLSIESSSKDDAFWHREMSLSYAALKKEALADTHQKQALSLAKKQKLPTWLVWELQ
ncbi:MAG: esterase [Gammaproteobacteria bacterium]|nr:MAG: esterase [Gammaproteobacteria bacterium]